MPLIQRNLFPARPPSKKCDGPSVLRQANQENTNNSNYQNIYVKSNAKIGKQHQQQQQHQKKLKKSQSASMLSLLAITNQANPILNHPIRQRSSSKGPSPSKKHQINNSDSQDSCFNSSSDGASSDPNSLCSSSSSVDNSMISRRRILSRSRDALNYGNYGNGNTTITTTASTDIFDDYSSGPFNHLDDDDVWFNKTKLISDHIEEIISKWDQIDDEIWAKVICMERNRRIAKAYARTPILTINGSDVGFDGHRIGLNGFQNPMRDKRTIEIKNKIEDGIKIRMDENGSLLVKRICEPEVNLISLDKSSIEASEKIEQRKSVLLFDMKQFHSELLREIKQLRPDTRILEQKCFSFISLGSIGDDLLNTPVWCIVINLVALEMLIKLLPNQMLDHFYSLPSSITSKGLSTNNNNNNNYNNYNNNSYYTTDINAPPIPPKLPPRDLNNKKPPLKLPEPDYEDNDNDNDNEDDGKFDAHNNNKNNNSNNNNKNNNSNNNNNNNNHPDNVINAKQNFKQNYIDDDPYYYGMSAHVPKFGYNNQNGQRPVTIPPQQPIISYRNNPPIIRKALNKKMASEQQIQQQPQQQQQQQQFGPMSPLIGPITPIPFPAPPPPPPPAIYDAGHYRYCGYGTNIGYGKYSTFDPMCLIPQTQFGYQYRFPIDNDEIYGINPALVRKNASYLRSTSSPSLKNIFCRKKTYSNDKK